MNNKNMKMGLRMLLVTTGVAMLASVVSAAEADAVSLGKGLGAGLALGLAGVGTGMSQGQIGAAAVGMVAEAAGKFVYGLIFTALPETIVLFGFLSLFLL